MLVLLIFSVEFYQYIMLNFINMYDKLYVSIAYVIIFPSA